MEHPCRTYENAPAAYRASVRSGGDQFAHKSSGQPLELLAMAEVLIESHLHVLGVNQAQIDSFLDMRDQLLRAFANQSGKKSSFAIASDLKDARNSADGLEEKVCAAMRSLGFEAILIGKAGKPDGVATAYLSASDNNAPQTYKVSLETKSKKKDQGVVAASTVDVAGVIKHRDEFDCQHALVVARAFPTTQGDVSTLSKHIEDDRAKTAALVATGALKTPKTITLISAPR